MLIEDEIKEHIDLERHGPYLRGVCLYHKDHNPYIPDRHKVFMAENKHLLIKRDKSIPSKLLFVSPNKQIFYCFGCQKGGDIVSFYNFVHKLSPIESAQKLIDKYNLIIPGEYINDLMEKQ